MADGRAITLPWWRKDVTGDQLRDAAWQFADGLWGSGGEVERRQNHLLYASQYLGRPLRTLTEFMDTVGSGGEVASAPLAMTARSTRNLTRTLVDTAMSRVAKAETRVQWLTNGGSESEQTKAEEATDAANALIQQTGGEEELRRAKLFTAIFDLGAVKEIDGDDGPEVEHVPSWEVMFDPADAHRGKPRVRVHRFPGARDALLAKFLAPKEGETPEEAADREERARKLSSDLGVGLVTADHTETEEHVIVYELWSDPQGKRPGRHVAVTEGVLLLDEQIKPGTKQNAPFVFDGWSAPVLGAYPSSIAEIVSALQLEIDGMKDRRGQILRLCAVPRYAISGPMGDGGVMDVQLRGGTDAIGDVVHVPPGCTVTPIPLGLGESLTALAQEEERAWTKGHEMVGVSQENTTGSRPNGLNSAPAQREWNEIADQRLAVPAMSYQKAHVELAELLLESIAERPDYEIDVKSPDGRFMRSIKAHELNLQKSRFKLIPYPISALPTTPTGKLAAAGDLLQMGGLDKDDFQEIVQLPDLKSKLNMNLASRRATEKLVGKMLVSKERIAPPECLEPVYALKYVTARWLNGVADDMDQEQLDLLQSWMDELGGRLQKDKAAAAPAPAVGAPVGAMPAGPAPADLLAPAPILGGRVGATPVPLAPGGVAPLQNHPFAAPVGHAQ